MPVADEILYKIVFFRTLMNQLLSHLCIIILLSNVVARAISVAVLNFGPFSASHCDVILFIGRYFFIGCLGLLTLRQAFKYFYIFQGAILQKLYFGRKLF
jgi:hypothetical protein